MIAAPTSLIKASTLDSELRTSLSITHLSPSIHTLRVANERSRHHLPHTEFDADYRLPTTHDDSRRNFERLERRDAAQSITSAMSAAAPLPPPTHAASSANGATNGVGNSSSSSNGGVGGGSGGERVYAHISDLKSDALSGLSKNSSQSQSITNLFAQAERSLQDARTNIDFRRPDIAFVDYLRAYEIAVEVIPRHRDYTHFIHDQHGQSKLQVLQRRLLAMSEQFDKIKEIIVNNNSRSGVRPRSLAAPAPKPKPSVSPKPEKLHSRPISMVVNGSGASSSNDIADRFAKLRAGGAEPSSRASMSLPRGTPIALDRDSGHAFAQSAPKPQGPRGMPLDTELAAAMPKAPAATYSPARNMQTTGDIAPPRHSARSLASQRKSNPLPSPALSATSSNGAPNGSGEYFNFNHRSSTPTTPRPTPRRKSVQMPDETRITAEKLHDYLERYDIMVIDCRARADFDQGHIYSRNVICIEPVGLRQGMSAEQLADKLVLSPEEEQEIFQNRDQYDLVVYHDANTRSETFLSNPAGESETYLKYLHEALYDFNQEKRLKRAPIILIGGIDAWVDLMGNQALLATNTHARTKNGRPLQRRPALRDGQMRVSKRGLRDYNPLDAEEEQKWRLRAQSESMPEAPALGDHGTDEDESSDTEQAQRFPHIDEFNARFPEAGVLGQQMPAPTSSTMSSRPGMMVPNYPATPAHSVYPPPPPPPPARPAPAAPRMSYTGVSDRAVAHSTPVPRTSSQLLPYVPQRYLAQNLRLPKTGIHNFGNTCYMNATLQALSATTPLTILMLDDQYKKMVQKDNWKGSRGLLPEIYANLVRSLWQGEVDFIKPSTMLTFCGRLNSTFKDPSQQQDAQEFFSFIVDCLHEDFNTVWSKMPLRVLTEQEEAKRERMPALVVAKTEWGRYIHRENSFLTSLFYGQHSSRLRCSTCSFTSTTYEAWALLQVEIPEVETRLQDCLRAHFRSEELDGENQWTCPRCKVPRRATKKLTMTRAPPFLVVALKRFKQNARGEQRKLSTAVRFPLTGLDMEEFILPQPSPSEVQEIARDYGHDTLKIDDSLSPPYVYDAYAVVRHMGSTTTSGHYTCVARDQARGCWRIFNDTQHRNIKPETLSPNEALDNNQAYFIFYQRRAANNESNGA